MIITEAIKKITGGYNLSTDETRMSFQLIMEGHATKSQIASFVTALRMKGETIEEITGAVQVMLEKAVTVPIVSPKNLIDIVGTGGDMSGTFNISTAAAFVACGAGLKLAKHGNRSASSSCGSADVIERLGVNIEITPEDVAKCIDMIGIGFLFAPKLHTAMRHASDVRKEIGIRTIFNMIGPLTNPANAQVHLIGVYDEKLTSLFAGVLKKTGKKKAFVVHGRDGLDEISLGSETVISELNDGEIKTYTVCNHDFGLEAVSIKDIKGGSIEDNASIIIDVLQGRPGPCRSVVLANAGAAIVLAGRAKDFKQGVIMAAESIDNGSALKKLQDLKLLSMSF